jgi:hypothetical protein
MYAVASPAAEAGRSRPPARPARIPLGLARVTHHRFGRGGPFGWDDHIYFPDLMRSYGIEVDAERFAGRRNSFMDMTTAIAARLHPYDDRFDVAVLTGVTPDSQPGYPMCHLSNYVAEAGLSFAVFDQGVVAPFTALYTLASTVWAVRATRGLLLVADQATLLHDRPVPERLRVGHDSAVLVVLDERGELGSMEVPRSWSVTGRELTGCLGRALREAAAGGRPVDVLVAGRGLGGWLPDPPPVPELRWSAPGLPATGVWAELAAGLPGWAGRGARVMLADFDERQRRLSACAVDVAPARRAGDRVG